MDCKDCQELVSAAVDNQLNKETFESFEEHVEGCSACRTEYELESITKSAVRTRVKMVPTPGVLLQRIAERLDQETALADDDRKRWWSDLLRWPVLRPTIAFSAAFVAVLLILNRSAGSNVIEQSLENYRAVVNGEMKPEETSGSPEILKSFFTGKTEFQVLVPEMKDCRLLGGLLGEYSGAPAAHVVYMHDTEIIYICQVCWETVLEGEALNLSSKAKDELQRTGWYTETRPDGYTIVLWTKGNTLCSAVAMMSEADLIACLTSANSAESTEW